MEQRPLTIGLDRRYLSWWPEITYVFRTLMNVAGFPHTCMVVKEKMGGESFDVYYGCCPQNIKAKVYIRASGIPFTHACHIDPIGFFKTNEFPILTFSSEPGDVYMTNSFLHVTNDIIFSSFWLLTGAREHGYVRDRWDNLDLDQTFFFQHDLGLQPLVSLYGVFFREHFQRLGHTPLAYPWEQGRHQGAFVLSHDVDYPQILRLIESIRLLFARGFKGLSSIKKVLRGENHFWKFPEWVMFEKELNARSAFYFMTRKGSLWQYVNGIPDAFYDISQKEFSSLFQYLRDEGFEIGLHASYEAYKNYQTIASEKQRLEELAGILIQGNRHHYWHLDPDAPHSTLRSQERAGFLYDSSLAFESYPGFRRGICHPFRPFHPGERRALDLVELSPMWMDDHFDRRLSKNSISDPSAYAQQLIRIVQGTGGVGVVDYHVRGMNQDFFPRYGLWLQNFIQTNPEVFHSMRFSLPAEVAKLFVTYEHSLDQNAGVPAIPTFRKPTGNSSAREIAVYSPKEPVRVGIFSPGEEEAWERFVAYHTQATVYHSLSWKMVTQEGLGHTPYYLRAMDGDGQVVGILPLFLVKGLYGKRLVSMPMRDRGGVVAQNALIASQLVGEAIRLTQELDCRYLEMKSFYEWDSALLEQHRLHDSKHWITTRLDLSTGHQNLWKALDRKYMRWAIKKAEKNGLRCIVDDTQGGMNQFFELFVRTRSSMGIPPFPQALFHAIWCHMVSKGKANLFLVYKDAVPIHGLINFFSHDVFLPAYAAPQKEWKNFHGNELIFWNAIQWACKQGFSYFDFGADSPHQEGLLWWKKKWGGTQHLMSTYHFLHGVQHPPNFDSSHPMYSLIRQVWRSFPIPVGKVIGGWVTKQLS